MILKNLAQSFDFLKPSLYKVEKAVAGQQIPSVVGVPDRKKLSDFDVRSTDQFDHSLWDGVLKRHIADTNGSIDYVKGIHLLDYEAISQDDNFKSYLKKLEEANVEALPEPEQLAFWMNAYNCLCVSHLINNMDKVKNPDTGIYSINNLSGSGNAVWDQEAGVVAGKKVSLNYIEHNELRLRWDEPAVHACIVCASASCPNLRQEAFVGSRVAEQMKDQMKNWMSNDTKGLVLKGRKLCLSRIFLWFGDDFGGWEGLRKWLPQYLEDGEAKERIEKDDVAVRFFEYSWQMNRKVTENTEDK